MPAIAGMHIRHISPGSTSSAVNHRPIIVDGLATHERAKPVDRGIRNAVREMEEEFPF